jgi:hypothetical protein
LLVCLAQTAPAASLEAGSSVLAPGAGGNLIVTGTIDDEATFGVTILIEILPRAGNSGSVEFTPAPPNDVIQLGDPWPGAGTFTPYDTDAIGFAASRNGSVDDNGTFLSSPVTYDGALAVFPIAAGPGASGVWDVVLSTSVGDSGWEDVATTFVAGTITVPAPSNVPTVSSWGLLIIGLLIGITGTVLVPGGKE